MAGASTTTTTQLTIDGSVAPEVNIREPHEPKEREKWGRGIEFLLSCIALSVGFGNIWRFPYTAMQNGGGAFLIPYLIVLLLVGRPLYYLEMVMGQFASRGCIKVFDVAPLMRGVGVGQTLALLLILGYYAAVLSVSVRYFVASFGSPLAWARCEPDWSGCVDSEFKGRVQNASLRPSAEYYFNRTVLHNFWTVEDGIGVPDWKLAVCLLFCWMCITGILIKGIRSSGKASYFLAIFPYVILLVLLVRTCTLEGADQGILYLMKPQWEKLIDVQVWYAAVTQCFFSLTISLGSVIVFASYNSFTNNIYRDAMIISWLDTFTSIVSGIVVFGIVGNIAHITGNRVEDMQLQGPQLTFITYPDAIAKFDAAQNVFAVLFFLMFFLLGLGSNTGIVTTIVTAVRDRFPQLPNWKVVISIAIYGFCCGLVYITPGGLHVLDVVDKYGVTLTTLTLVMLEIVTFCWMYGVEQIGHDIQLMLSRRTGVFWRVCWSFVTFGIIAVIWVFSFIQYTPLPVPLGMTVFGWCLFAFVISQVAIWAVYALCERKEEKLLDRLKAACQPTSDWGPENSTVRSQYRSERSKRFEENRAQSVGVGKCVLRKMCNTFVQK
ncbi:sodium-dependent nutrient amino acid transporter 1-like [Anopheles arabiensis]|uniref:sodium-dependent nutrient amino acid transporter 1-like n=1 Tax=Anopheles arabiensis TaxID=7173 RepID=UPI001AAD7A4B|nr:sodium-dependent nutrient amino acid transporter 1-like [Anopheles arabiensis]XP_040164033.1 sodium-dependent nutrient amino acid transporter 1-like [Anopheles arabiensis]XP_040164034.1 sodium-dependent nutrient amino acid transporter 1-like [Anopheles arabiensis]XP_040164035.1 sodium-dependent nutrient amino acid transporter 1-like [Anopheles arabiensis]